jgi:hypothetical protein
MPRQLSFLNDRAAPTDAPCGELDQSPPCPVCLPVSGSRYFGRPGRGTWVCGRCGLSFEVTVAGKPADAQTTQIGKIGVLSHDIGTPKKEPPDPARSEGDFDVRPVWSQSDAAVGIER